MRAGEIFAKTMPFCMARLMLGLLTIAISAVILAVLMAIAWLFTADGVTGILLLVWLAATGFVRFLLMHYVGYLVKAGHVAVIAEAVVTGQIPADQVAYGKRMVTERFASANVYFAVDKLVGGAVRELQSYLQRAGNALDVIPGMAALVKVGKLFLEISLGYVDECCLGYTFYKRGQGAYKSAADGVMVYAQNWKKLFSVAAKTTLVVVVLLCAVTLVAFVVLGLLCKLFGLPGYIAFLVACLIAYAVKFAFIDSYVLVNMMVMYMEVAPTTEIAFDLYGELCAVSSKFAELYEKGKSEILHSGATHAAADHQPGPDASAADEQHEAPTGHLFCGACGEKNIAGAKFCGKCGAALQG
jgi:hypothetical protein